VLTPEQVWQLAPGEQRACVMPRGIECRLGCNPLHDFPDGLDSLAQRADRPAMRFPDTLERSQLSIEMSG